MKTVPSRCPQYGEVVPCTETPSCEHPDRADLDQGEHQARLQARRRNRCSSTRGSDVGMGRAARTRSLHHADESCIFVCMRTTLDLDRQLVEQALRETGAKSKTEVIEMGLRLLLERGARQRLKALAGRLQPLREVSRRRP